MSEKVLKLISLSDLKAVRIRCNNSADCSGVIEMNMDNFSQLGQRKLVCPVCSLAFAGPVRPALESLGNAIASVKAQEIAAHFQVEFVISD